MGHCVGAIPRRGGLAPCGGPRSRTVRTEGSGGHSRLAGGAGRGGGIGRAQHRRRAPQTCAGSWATFIEAKSVEEEERRGEKMGEKLEVKDYSGKYQALKE